MTKTLLFEGHFSSEDYSLVIVILHYMLLNNVILEVVTTLLFGEISANSLAMLKKLSYNGLALRFGWFDLICLLT